MTLCPNKTICGSCEWSEIPYEDQLNKKLEGIKALFLENGLPAEHLEILPSPKTSHYRNRMDLAIDFQGNLGLREKGKWWKVIDGHICFIADEKIEEVFHIARDWVKSCSLTYYDRRKFTGLLRYIVFRASLKGETLLNVVTSGVSDEEEKVLLALKDLAERTNVTTLLWSQNLTQSDVSFGDKMQVISGEGFIHEEINGIVYRIYPNSFFQTNSSGAALLQQKVSDFAESVGIAEGVKTGSLGSVADLYCGAGFFTLALKKNYPTANITGIEEVEDAIKGAQINAQLNKMGIQFIKAKSEEINLGDVGQDGAVADLIIVDPPRAGMHPKMLLNLLDSGAKNIIYVSCRYENFVKDYNLLRKKYEFKKSVAVDMFPHTHHVELVSLLSKWN